MAQKDDGGAAKAARILESVLKNLVKEFGGTRVCDLG